MAWDPTQYLKFADHRLRPAIDLLNRIDVAEPGEVVDLGAGAGNVTRLIKMRWPTARVTGVDTSPEMLAKAAAAAPEITWVLADLGRWRPERPVDVIYSNAALHWLEGHDTLFPALLSSLAPGGVLAVQMPRNFSAPSHTSMLAPGVLFLIAFVAYPFFYGIYLSLQERQVAKAGLFVGLGNFVTLFHDGVFWQVSRNTFLYTIVTTVLKLLGGLAMALVMNQAFRGRNLARAFLLLPFIVPTILSTIAWMWIFDPTFSVINWTLVHTGAIRTGFSWLGNASLAMVAIIIVNTWRGIPFYGITLLAGLQTISPELYEAAAMDGASINQRFWHVTLPIIKPILIIVTMFSIIFTFADFQIVYALTHGGPANATQVYVTYAFDLGMSAGQLGMGAAAALTMLPALVLLIIGLTLYLRRE